MIKKKTNKQTNKQTNKKYLQLEEDYWRIYPIFLNFIHVELKIPIQKFSESESEFQGFFPDRHLSPPCPI